MLIQRFGLRNLAFAFIELPNKAAVLDAIFNLEGKFLQGRDLKIELPLVDPGLFLARFREKPCEYFQDFERDHNPNENLQAIKEGRQILVRGFSVTSERLRHNLIDIFRPFAVDFRSKVKRNWNGKFLFMEKSTQDEADGIISEFHGKELLGATLQVQRLVVKDAEP